MRPESQVFVPMIEEAAVPGDSAADEPAGGGRAPDRNEILPLEELERRAILKTLHETSGD